MEYTFQGRWRMIAFPLLFTGGGGRSSAWLRLLLNLARAAGNWRRAPHIGTTAGRTFVGAGG